MEKQRKDVALRLVAAGVVQVSPGSGFALSKHPDRRDRTSPVYYNIVPQSRGGPVSAETVDEIGSALSVLRSQQQVLARRYAAVSEDVLPYLSAMVAVIQPIATFRPVPFQFEERPATDTTDRKIVEVSQAAYMAGDEVLVMDGVLVSAHRTYAAIQVLRQMGLAVNDVVVIVDRCQGGSDELKRKGLRVHHLFTARELLQVAMEAGTIYRTEYDLAWRSLDHSYPDVLPDG